MGVAKHFQKTAAVRLPEFPTSVRANLTYLFGNHWLTDIKASMPRIYVILFLAAAAWALVVGGAWAVFSWISA